VIKGLSGPKMVEFCYDNYTREIEPDHGADHPYYEAHDIIVRKGKIWIITQVALQYVLSGPKSPLTLVLSLSEHRPVASSSDQTSEVYETIFPQFIHSSVTEAIQSNRGSRSSPESKLMESW
jgi:hypothetical protein